jgi:hypothetical protein
MENGSWPPQHDGSMYIKREIVRSYYDKSPVLASNPLPNDLVQQNLRNRVAATAIFEDFSATFENYTQATFYSYDIHGNVNWLARFIYGVSL